MRRLLIAWALMLTGIVCLFVDVPRAQVNLPLMGVGRTASATCNASTGPPATFIARTSGESAGTQSAIVTFMCGLVTDGLLSSASTGYCTSFDILYVLWLDNAADSLLNWCANSFNLVGHGGGSQHFTANVGWDAANSATSWLSTGWVASTNGVTYAQDNDHISVYMTSNSPDNSTGFQGPSLWGGLGENLYSNLENTDDNTYMRTNDNPESGGFNLHSSSTSKLGHYIGVRTSSTARQGYFNGSSSGITYGSTADQAPTATTVVLLSDASGTNSQPGTMGAASMGAAMNSTQANNFYTRFHTFCAAVIGAGGTC